MMEIGRGHGGVVSVSEFVISFARCGVMTLAAVSGFDVADGDS